jgi:uncharacterized protein DUF2617
MRTALATSYADTRAEALSFALGLEPLEALAVLPLERHGVRVELRLLGASHQVFAGPISETVACLPETPGPLPGSVQHELDGGWRYDFTARIDNPGRGFEQAVDELCARLGDRPDALTGTFPGSPYAVTALALETTGLGWRTWHAYPQTREIVVTRTLLEVA